VENQHLSAGSNAIGCEPKLHLNRYQWQEKGTGYIKKPESLEATIRDIPFLSPDTDRCGAFHVSVTMRAQVGLLTFGSFYDRAFPTKLASGNVRFSSPITAAGPSPNFTEFPVMLKTAPEQL
jgi:hypothetical protein